MNPKHNEMQENINNNPYIDDEQEIDIMELISKLWKKKSMIIKWCIAGAIIGLIAGFSIPKTYTASTDLAIESSDAGSAGGGLSSLASMAGINIGGGGADAINVDMYPDVVHSTPFIVDLFDLPVEFERKGEIINTTLLDYMLEYQKSPWWTPIIQSPLKAFGWVMSIGKDNNEDFRIPINELNISNLPRRERSVVNFFAKNIVINVDKKTGKIRVSLDLQDPQVVYVVVEAVVNNLVDYMSDYRSSKARQDAENLSKICEERKAEYYKAQQAYANFVDSNKSVVRQSAQAELERLQQEMNLAYQIYSQVATNLEAARIQEQQAKPVFVTISPVTIPLDRTAPSKVKFVLIFSFLSACISAAWIIFGANYWKIFRESL